VPRTSCPSRRKKKARFTTAPPDPLAIALVKKDSCKAIDQLKKAGSEPPPYRAREISFPRSAMSVPG